MEIKLVICNDNHLFLEKRIWLTLEQKAPKYMEMGNVHGKMSSLSPESTESMVMFLLWQLPGGNGVHLSDPAPPSSAGQYNACHGSLKTSFKSPSQKSLSVLDSGVKVDATI